MLVEKKLSSAHPNLLLLEAELTTQASQGISHIVTCYHLDRALACYVWGGGGLGRETHWICTRVGSGLLRGFGLAIGVCWFGEGKEVADWGMPIL